MVDCSSPRHAGVRGTGILSDTAVEGDVVSGPGIYDMRAGLAQVVLAMEVLHDLQHTPTVTPLLLVNSDEEVGSAGSTATIKRLSGKCERVFVLEPSLSPSGKLKTARKGVGRFQLKRQGKAAHAGLDPERGASAILELSHVIRALFDLNDLERGITVNVGQIDGGVRPNVIAPTSSAVVDARVPTSSDADRIARAIHDICPITAGVTISVSGGFGRAPLERTQRNRVLWHMALDAAQALGMRLEEGTAGGGSDGNITSLCAATLDGLGAVGDGAHAAHEHILLKPTLERAALPAMLLLAPPTSVVDVGGHDNEERAARRSPKPRDETFPTATSDARSPR